MRGGEMKREGESWRGDRERWGGRNRDNGGKREKDSFWDRELGW